MAWDVVPVWNPNPNPNPNSGRANDRWALIGQCPPADLRGVRLRQRLPESHAGSHRTQVRQQGGGDQVLRPGPVPQTRVLTAAPRSRTFTPNRADSRGRPGDSWTPRLHLVAPPDGRKCNNNNDLQAGRDFPSEHKDFRSKITKFVCVAAKILSI